MDRHSRLNDEAMERADRLVTLALADDAEAVGAELRGLEPRELVRTVAALAASCAAFIEAVAEQVDATPEAIWRTCMLAQRQ